jgi:AbrB family looped-hinge helix DNA binding protein
MTMLTVSSKGWVVIPADLRRKYDLSPGTRVMLVDYGGVLTLVPALDDPVEQSYGLLAGGPSLTKALLAEHAKERAREDKTRSVRPR